MGAQSQKVQPHTTALTEPYWTGCREGELRLQQCNACERYQFYPRILCSHCGHRDLSWRAVTGRGRIASYTIINRPLSDAYPAPSIIALVDLAEGPRMMSSITGSEPESLDVGAEVAVDFSAWSDEVSMPVFRIVSEGSES